MVGLAGFDFVLIDGEHGSGDHQAHLACLQGVAATQAHSIFRVECNDPTVLKRALDLGVEGVMVPNVASVAEARAVVASCQYAPKGVRGFAASGVRASDYGFQTERYLRDAGSELLIAVMIESRAGVEDIVNIASVDGIDVIQVGANDLSYDLGIPEQFDHPLLTDAISRIEDAALKHGKALGGAPVCCDVLTLLRRGYRLITLGRDVSLLGKGLTHTLSAATASIRVWRSAGDEK